MRTSLTIIVAALLTGCTTAPPVPGQPGRGESFSGSVSQFSGSGDLTISSNRGRTCWGTYRISSRKGRGVVRCDDGTFGQFRFEAPPSSRTASGTVTLADTPYTLTIRS